MFQILLRKYGYLQCRLNTVTTDKNAESPFKYQSQSIKQVNEGHINKYPFAHPHQKYTLYEYITRPIVNKRVEQKDMSSGAIYESIFAANTGVLDTPARCKASQIRQALRKFQVRCLYYA